jgi:hypothetical protein
VDVPSLYKKYFVDKGDEREELFQQLRDTYGPRRALYPGSFVHITPSFFIPEMSYVDVDRRAARFFTQTQVLDYVSSRKTYPEQPSLVFHSGDFSLPLPFDESSFDMLLSFYSGFISLYCKAYLRPSGILVANNSHGDASLAALDPDYRLVAVVNRRGTRFSLSSSNLRSYLKKKDGSPIDRERVLRTMIGERFSNEAFAYVFEKHDEN